MSKEPLTSETVERVLRGLVAAHLHTEVCDLQQMTCGHGSLTYRAVTSKQTVIVRTNSDASQFAATAQNLDILCSMGFPVPTILVGELTSMNECEQTALAKQIVAIERAVGTLPLNSRYGYTAIGSIGAQDTWSDVVRSQRNPSPTNSNSTIAPLVRRTLEQFQAAKSRLDKIEPTCFLDDLTTKNVIVYNGELQGLVDFDVVCSSDRSN